MPRFIIRRTWGEIDEAAMAEYGRRSRQAAAGFPGIVWEHSHVVVDPEGQVMSFCVYQSPDASTLAEHGQSVGGHFIDEIIEIVGDITPEDFPLEPRPSSPE